MQEPAFAWIDGELVEFEKANVPILTHALHYGTAVIEGIRAYKTGSGLSVFRLKEHMTRFRESAHAYMMPLPYSEADLCEATTTLLAKNEMRDSCYIRPIAFKTTGVLKLDLRKVPTSVAIAAIPFEKIYEKPGLDACVSSWRRTGGSSVLPLAKASGQYVNSILGKVEAAQDGYDEAIFLDQNGFVSEGSGQNIFIVKKGTVCTPPITAGILEGITRDSVKKIAVDDGLPVQERDIARGELYTCDEAFFAGTAAEITPILTVDRRTVGAGDHAGAITQRLQELYSKAVSGEDTRYKDWLTPVYCLTSMPSLVE